MGVYVQALGGDTVAGAIHYLGGVLAGGYAVTDLSDTTQELTTGETITCPPKSPVALPVSTSGCMPPVKARGAPCQPTLVGSSAPLDGLEGGTLAELAV